MAIKHREDCKQIVEKAAHQRTRTEAGIQMVTQRMVELDEAAQITRRLIGESIVQMTVGGFLSDYICDVMLTYSFEG